ncbi:hypothetical protein JQM84_07635 [Parabacteroides distasonis]|nr:hypothetical protein [Parabacteroides distasonis]
MKTRQWINSGGWLLSLFLAGSFGFFEWHYRYFYRFLEQYMLFQTTESYAHTLLGEPGGGVEYVAEFLTQYFTIPGFSSMTIALLLGFSAAGLALFLRGCGGLSSTMWISLLPGLLFWFFPQESIAPLLTVGIACWSTVLYSAIERPMGLRYLVGLVLLTLTYFLAAPANLLLGLFLGMAELFRREGTKSGLVAVAWLAVSALLPLVAMRTCFVVPMREAYLSKYMCHPEYPVPTSLFLLGLAYPFVALLRLLWGERVLIRRERWRMPLAFGSLLVCMAWPFLTCENRMEQAYHYDDLARKEDWKAIVADAQKQGVRDVNALVYVNLALSHTGQMANGLLRFPQIGVEGLIPKEPKSRLGLIQASEVTWRMGQVNAAQRFAFVGVLSSQRCVQPRLMKRLVESYLVNGEYRAAEKYIRILEAAPRYRDWAKQQRTLLDPEKAAQSDWIVAKRKQLPVTDNPFDLTVTYPSAIAYLLDDHPDNRAAFEYAMAYLLIYKDLGTFMHYMEQKRQRGEEFPVGYQEAICLYYSMQVDPEAFKRYPISDEVKGRFMRFAQQVRSLTPVTAKAQYGDTYYYYAQFARTLKEE